MSAREFSERFQRRARRLGLAVPPDVKQRLARYFDLLSRWNQKINLTSLENPDEAIDRLLLEPLLAARYLQETEQSVLDIGSGGGSPAIPLKIVSPSISLWMVESKTRKSAFLREAVRQLGLGDVRIETARFEELLTRPELHEAMNIVTIRAVRVETRALMSLQAYLRPAGRIFWFRGPAGPDVPTTLMPPLTWESTQPLVDSLRSRLVILRKA
ncbi:MAG: 16S rRNA (guanine(527)-N(7))-methyltransferase RsmG, partial [Acidobacteria bacterium]|nr:16S rRNA (guanine(527)-N(7))-methyltransferase RsmG [Acidobacteriota bacterium]